jgi:hypothetical protein
MLANALKAWDYPSMVTLKADSRRRVSLPNAKPGQVFAYQLSGKSVMLTPVKADDEVPIVRPVRRPDGTYFWPAKLSKQDIVAAIRADRDAK